MDDYAAHVEERMSRLQRKEIVVRQDISYTHLELVRAVADIEIELDALKKEVAQLEEDMHRTASRAKSAVGLFKTVAKRGELVRLQNRIDAFSPQSRITREQFLRMLRS